MSRELLLGRLTSSQTVVLGGEGTWDGGDQSTAGDEMRCANALLTVRTRRSQLLQLEELLI